MDDLIGNDEKVASSIKIKIKHNLFMTKIAKIDTIFMNKTTKTCRKRHSLQRQRPEFFVYIPGKKKPNVYNVFSCK